LFVLLCMYSGINFRSIYSVINRNSSQVSIEDQIHICPGILFTLILIFSYTLASINGCLALVIFEQNNSKHH
jgi:hypothetical protein